ncbi:MULTISPECIES: helix-turn-helix domain-containing protein [unclassified Pseudomonas]|uniref:helix-turn-helix domain-containing protein n=1 Tax=unclassified Pseudomonas TaxID=196821 RepID=UPI000A1F9484|nr:MULTISPECIES: helix-turn-helix domain-containing protein [unclassified Pseudomonas]
MNPHLFHFSSQAYPPAQRFEVWRDEVNAIFQIGIEQALAPRFNYQLSTGYAGSILIGCGSWVGAGEPVAYGVRRPQQMIRRDGLDHLYLCLGLNHSLHGMAGRTPLQAGPSSIYVLDLARELDSQIIAGDTVILTLARDLLSPRIRAANLHGSLVRGPLGSLLGDYLRSLRRQLPSFHGEELAAVEQATLAMVSAALAPSAQSLAEAEGPINRTLLQRVRRFIEAHLRSAELSPQLICREVGISRAQLYRLFAEESGVVAYIQQCRLDRVRRILESPLGANQRISALAFDHGFKSESHFSRVFRQAFGYSPRDARDRRSATLPAKAGAVSVEGPGSLLEVLDRLDTQVRLRR